MKKSCNNSVQFIIQRNLPKPEPLEAGNLSKLEKKNRFREHDLYENQSP